MPSRFLLSDSPPPLDHRDRNRAILAVSGFFFIVVICFVYLIKLAYDEQCNPPAGSGNPVNPRPGVDALPVHRPPAGAGNRPVNPRQEAPPVRVHHHRSPPPPPQQPARAVDGLPFLKFSDETRTLVAAAEEGCVICLSEFESGDDLTVLPKCNHGFHVMCIEGWWKEFHSCPTCRTMY